MMKKVCLNFVFTAVFAVGMVSGLYAQPDKPQKPVTPVATKTGTATPTKTTNKIPTGALIFDPCAGKAVTINDGILKSDHSLPLGSIMWSPNHVYHLMLDTTGNLVIFDNTRLDGQYIHTIWSSGTANKGVTCGRLNSKAGFGLFDTGGKRVWFPLVTYFTSNIVTGASSAIGVSLVLDNDGTLHYMNADGKSIIIYDGKDQNKKPEPKYIGDTSFQRWNKGQSLKPGTRLYAPDLKAVLVCDDTGLWIGAADLNEVSFPKYVSTKLKEVTECVFLANGNLAVHQPNYGKGWTTQTQGLGGTYIHVNGLKMEAFMVDDSGSQPKIVWNSAKGKQ